MSQVKARSRPVICNIGDAITDERTLPTKLPLLDRSSVAAGIDADWTAAALGDASARREHGVVDQPIWNAPAALSPSSRRLSPLEIKESYSSCKSSLQRRSASPRGETDDFISRISRGSGRATRHELKDSQIKRSSDRLDTDESLPISTAFLSTRSGTRDSYDSIDSPTSSPRSSHPPDKSPRAFTALSRSLIENKCERMGVVHTPSGPKKPRHTQQAFQSLRRDCGRQSKQEPAVSDESRRTSQNATLSRESHAGTNREECASGV